MSLWTNVRVTDDTLHRLKEFRVWLEYSVALHPAKYPAYLKESDRLSLADCVKYLIEKHGTPGSRA